MILRSLRPLGVAFVTFAATACASVGSGGGFRTRRAVDAVVDAPPLDQVHFGILAVDVRTGATLYARKASSTLVP